MIDRTRALLVLSTAGFLPCLSMFLLLEDARTRYSVAISAAVSLLGFLATRRAIPVVKEFTLRSNLYGMDINKRGARRAQAGSAGPAAA